MSILVSHMREWSCGRVSEIQQIGVSHSGCGTLGRMLNLLKLQLSHL